MLEFTSFPTTSYSRFLAGLRLLTAINKESITNCLFIELLIDQPTTMREYRSIIVAKYSHPSLVFI